MRRSAIAIAVGRHQQITSTLQHGPTFAQSPLNLHTIVTIAKSFNATSNHTLRAARSRRIERVATATTIQDLFWTTRKPIATGRVRLGRGVAEGFTNHIALAPRNNGAHTGELVESRRTTERGWEEQTRAVREEFGQSAATE